MRRGFVLLGWEGGGGWKEGIRIGFEVLFLLDFLDVEVDGVLGMGELVGGVVVLFEECFVVVVVVVVVVVLF